MAQELRYRKVWQLVQALDGTMVRSGLFDTEAYLADVEVVGAEATKTDALSKIIVTVSTGKEFYADPISRADLTDAIAIALETAQSSTTWKLPVVGWTLVTLAEMQEARLRGLQAKGGLI